MNYSKFYYSDNTILNYHDLKKNLHREDGPAIEHYNGDKFWYKNNLLHRDNDLPAIEFKSGCKFWYQNGKRHRLNNPAVIFSSGIEIWYNGGEQVLPYSIEEQVLIKANRPSLSKRLK